MSLPLPHSIAGVAGGDGRARTAEGAGGTQQRWKAGWGLPGSRPSDSLSWFPASLRSQCLGPHAPFKDLLPMSPPTQCAFQTQTLHLPLPCSALPSSGQLVCGWQSQEEKSGEEDICGLRAHLATPAHPCSMCICQLTCPGTGDWPHPLRNGRLFQEQQKTAQDRVTNQFLTPGRPQPTHIENTILRVVQKEGAWGQPPSSWCLIFLPIVSSPLIPCS